MFFIRTVCLQFLLRPGFHRFEWSEFLPAGEERLEREFEGKKLKRTVAAGRTKVKSPLTVFDPA